jgi:hypothetical protein
MTPKSPKGVSTDARWLFVRLFLKDPIPMHNKIKKLRSKNLFKTSGKMTNKEDIFILVLM